ncbi:MAG: hypothetical protein L6R36_001968 [Xanthoria steineri]|nr:MAG: hypothetical protein L6R36_001968 [Xanthoria steineri]
MVGRITQCGVLKIRKAESVALAIVHLTENDRVGWAGAEAPPHLAVQLGTQASNVVTAPVMVADPTTEEKR